MLVVCLLGRFEVRHGGKPVKISFVYDHVMEIKDGVSLDTPQISGGPAFDLTDHKAEYLQCCHAKAHSMHRENIPFRPDILPGFYFAISRGIWGRCLMTGRCHSNKMSMEIWEKIPTI
jgi:hypothetical protein